MKLHHLQGREKFGYTTFGCIWDKGEVKAPVFKMVDGCGKELPVQSKVLAWWPDRSVKWSAHTANAGKMPETVEVLNGESNLQAAEHEIKLVEDNELYHIDTGKLQLQIDKKAGKQYLAKQIKHNGVLLAKSVYPVFIIEHREQKDNVRMTTSEAFAGEILSVEIEEAGPLQMVVCFRGNHVKKQNSGAVMPFVIRMYLWADSEEIRFQHTFLYDGNEDEDYLKGMGIRFDMVMSEKLYDRHIQFGTDKAHFHEAAVNLTCNRPRIGAEILQKQLNGEFIEYAEDGDVAFAEKNLPVWNDYSLYQDSAYHYGIRKTTGEGCCDITCMQGKRAPGVIAVNSKHGGVLLGIRDFWQKYPSGLEVCGLGEKETSCTVWFYSPKAEAFDFRHYSKKSYPDTCYEGFPYVGASAYGIGVTSECTARFTENFAPAGELYEFALAVQKPPVYVGEPSYYHDKKAFGYWSLPSKETEVECWLEEQLERSFEFYKEEVEARDWYGLFDYGDVMHTYDGVRHVWKYDHGGMAWQNTELVPTYWLWLYFLRTGREDVFTFMEAMSRHCSEVDVYHFGPLQGLGSRHNVRHWGCSCKEPRIAMSGHHRFLYYLTGDARLRDIFENVKDSDYAMVAREKSRKEIMFPGEEFKAGVRSGPDWSSYVSNWMTWYEITLDEKYRKRIEAGIEDIAATPYGLASGPDYFYDLETAHLIYKGEEENTPNQHLQICMGGPQIWWEVADMLNDDRLNKLLEELGAFYYLDKEEKARLTGGLIQNRDFSWPMFATGISGYTAKRRNDQALAKLSWEILIKDLWKDGGRLGYEPTEYAKGTDGKSYKEIPWNTTNTAAQWGLNVIMCMEFIREYLPESMAEVERWMKDNN